MLYFPFSSGRLAVFFSFPILTRWTEREINGDGELEAWDGDNKGMRIVKEPSIFRKIRSSGSKKKKKKNTTCHRTWNNTLPSDGSLKILKWTSVLITL